MALVNFEGGRTWTIAPHIAWVAAETDAVAFVDLDVDLTPRLVPEPAATLWRGLDPSGCSESDLVDLAENLVGGQGRSLVEAFIEQLNAIGVLIIQEGKS